ncbi:allophanate hydrolase [Pigmentiphaga sp.]|uniref:allophanate hydrolase n=1 Tax=Pigmentiphaga sp. TaxID=1977564 RepID=UPI0025F58A3D|nr:allophanate hydrolase [Pigmentiphaga sp.]MBX6317374.1 allophanate hydrolase [Pigmentiphaga sp.]
MSAWIRRISPALATQASGPLANVRVAVKDNIDVAGVPTTCACPDFAYTPATSAVVVQKLLDAGASIVGKTNLDQFACGLNGTRSPFGAVPNALRPEYVSGGSSSGSAWAVATGEADVALGTDTAGSGRVPAGFNNIVGLKPSIGLLSAKGVFPASRSFDTVSIFARTVAEAVDVLNVLADTGAVTPDLRAMPENFCFGVPMRPEFAGDVLAAEAYEAACRRLESLGGTAVPIDDAPLAEVASWLYESALVAERYEAIRDFFDARPEAVIEPVRTIIGGGRKYSAADVLAMQVRLDEARERLAATWRDIDVLAVPTAPTLPTIAAMLADPVDLNRTLGRYTNFVNLLRWAALAVPAAMRPDGLPFGITLIGPSGSDWRLAQLGQRFHHATGLPQGALGTPLPAPREIAPPLKDALPIAVVGAHLSGMPLNWQLTELGARKLCETRTAPEYRLYALPGTTPPKPGLVRVGPGGAAIVVEVWNLPLHHVGAFLKQVASPLGIGSVALEDGTLVHGFVCEPWAVADARDVSEYGGWRRYVQSLG